MSIRSVGSSKNNGLCSEKSQLSQEHGKLSFAASFVTSLKAVKDFHAGSSIKFS